MRCIVFIYSLLLLHLLPSLCLADITTFLINRTTSTYSHTLKSYYTTLGNGPKSSFFAIATFLSEANVTSDCMFKVCQEKEGVREGDEGEKGLFYLIAPQGIDRMELMGRALVFMGTLSTFHGCNRYNHLILSYPTIFHLVIINRHLGGPGVAFARMAQSSGAVAVVIQQREKVTLIILQDYYSFAYSSSFFLSVLAWPDDGHDPSCYHPLLGCTSGCHGIPGYQSSSDCCHSVSYYLTSWYSIRHIIMMSLMYTYISLYQHF